MSNASALFRSLLVYGICLPLAVFLGYLLATPETWGTVSVVSVVFAVLVVPLLLRWHHAWLIATWNTTAMLFFIPGHPQVWMGLAAASFTISILQYTLNRQMKFLSAPTVAWPVIFFTIVMLITARLTGGLGARAFGGDTYGGKKYFTILAAILGYFAMTNRQLPPKRAALYTALFFLGGATMAIGNLPGLISPSLNFIFAVFPVMTMDAFTDPNAVVGQTSMITRTNGLAFMGLGVFCAMLACYGIRGVLDNRKPWRLITFCLFFLISMMGGFRSTTVLLLFTFALLFYLEGLHRTRLALPVVLLVVLGCGMVAVFAGWLPYALQRSLAFVPYIPLDPLVRLDAAGSTEWRMQIWRDVIPQIPQYFLLGKGYAFSGMEQVQVGNTMEATEFVGDYHNGPLSVIMPFGIFGVIGFTWFLVSSLKVVYHNYQFGDPALHKINTFLFAFFTIKVAFFLTIFGALHADMPMFLGMVGLSISLNGGVAKPVVVPQPKMIFNRFKLHPSARRPIGA